MTAEQITALKAQGFNFRATADGEVQFTPEEEAEWAADIASRQASAPRRLIAKSLVQDRLIAAGKLSAVLAVLKTDDAAYVRWFAPDHPNVYFDDDAMLQVLTYVGADIPTITAP